jgi:serine phosphatase RsbU (regulator of sigma subunit)
VSKGDSLYLTSDGYKDQFGGPEKKKFKSRQFEKMIEENHKFSMQAQSYLYENKFNDWKGRLEQVDDVSLIGIKF